MYEKFFRTLEELILEKRKIIEENRNKLNLRDIKSYSEDLGHRISTNVWYRKEEN